MYIRGVAMSKHSGVLRSLRQRLMLFERKIGDCESRALLEGNAANTEALKQLLAEYQEEADTEVQHLGKYARARAYGEGDRPGSVLANMMKAKRHKTTVLAIRSAEGALLTEEEEIANRFRQYYSELYASRASGMSDEILDYLEHIQMPFLSGSQREFLMHPIE